MAVFCFGSFVTDSYNATEEKLSYLRASQEPMRKVENNGIVFFFSIFCSFAWKCWQRNQHLPAICDIINSQWHKQNYSISIVQWHQHLQSASLRLWLRPITMLQVDYIFILHSALGLFLFFSFHHSCHFNRIFSLRMSVTCKLTSDAQTSDSPYGIRTLKLIWMMVPCVACMLPLSDTRDAMTAKLQENLDVLVCNV